MKETVKKLTGRRSFLRGAAATAGAGFWANETLDAALQYTNTASKPADLKITDVRMAGQIIRLDTNQGLVGYGENRDGAIPSYVMELKWLVTGENPCSVDKIFRKIKQFGYHGRQGGGVSGMEIALWDLAGKAYNVPIWQMLGGKHRDKIRIYCDTPGASDPAVFKQRFDLRRKDGFTFFKADVGINLVQNVAGTVVYPSGADISGSTVHMFTGMEITDKGIALMADYMAKVREAAGWEVPIATDHFGHIGVNSCIRLAKAFEKYNLAWMEDFIPWQYTDLWKKITDAVEVPTLTGEDIYLKEGFIELAKNHATDLLQPDLLTSGGILETHKLGDAIQEYGVPMVLHNASGPVGSFANVRRPRRTSWCSRTTRWITRPGAIRLRTSSQSSTRATSTCPTGRVSESRWTKKQSRSSCGSRVTSSPRPSGISRGAATTGSGADWLSDRSPGWRRVEAELEVCPA
jgi:L-alanine-DL-glutamate epimerase-like enolase superfamily enzyme